MSRFPGLITDGLRQCGHPLGLYWRLLSVVRNGAACVCRHTDRVLVHAHAVPGNARLLYAHQSRNGKYLYEIVVTGDSNKRAAFTKGSDQVVGVLPKHPHE